MVEQIFADNHKLRQKMGHMQDAFDARSKSTTDSAETNSIKTYSCEDQNSASTRTANQNDTWTMRTNIPTFAFEAILQNSWVYRRNSDGECDRSFIHSEQRSHAWSCFSGYNLADISILSVISLPLTQADITNGENYNFTRLADYTGDTAHQSTLAHVKDHKAAGGKELENNALPLVWSQVSLPDYQPRGSSLGNRKVDDNFAIVGVAIGMVSQGSKKHEHITDDLCTGSNFMDVVLQEYMMCMGCGKVCCLLIRPQVSCLRLTALQTLYHGVTIDLGQFLRSCQSVKFPY
jgi:hypothetical protein